ncbi:helix-turn-helix domain-containing protein, partial [Acuticoccus kandeliae]|uniref:helix-turn-helix domain-containing protein n=1 Tax=Acuticoccus kandeliae TaxID=2073160 RepID=UPI001300841F
MNNPHKNARTTVHSRALIVTRRAEGRPVKRIAEELGISERTVFKWLRRHREGGVEALANGASAAPPAACLNASVAAALRLRREYRLTAAEIAHKLRLARSTVARWLHRAGLGRLKALEPKEPPRRYQRERPGEFIHLDIKKLGRFERAGHRVTGSRLGHRNRGAGWDFVHVAIDDATRLAYVEILADEKRGTTTGFLVRA